MPAKRLFYILFISAKLFLISSASAQVERVGLSQLDFDEKIVTPKVSLQLNSVTNRDNSLKSKPKTIVKRASLSDSLLTSGSRYVVPMLSTDLQSVSRVVTASRWKPTVGGSCTGQLSIAQLCQKSKALKELLIQYSGDDYFAKRECSEACADQRKLALYGMEVTSLNKTQFSIVKDKFGCYYQLEKEAEQSWTALEVSSSNCACLPVDCLR